MVKKPKSKKIEKTKYTVRNWKEYNEALRQKTEVLIKSRVLNKMTKLGMLESCAVAV